MPAVRRQARLAGLWSLVVPGLGQVYNGQALNGVLFYGLYGIVVLAYVVILLELSFTPLNIVFPLGVILAGSLYILVDAVKTARRQRETWQPKVYNRWYVSLAIIVLFAFVIQPTERSTLRKVWVQAFKIPKDEYRLVLIDARGHGASDKPHEPEAYSFPNVTADVVAVLDTLTIAKAHYFGFSMGGQNGFALAAYAPERLRSLSVLGDTAAAQAHAPLAGPFSFPF